MEHQFSLGSFHRENETAFSEVLFISENFQWNDPKSRVSFASQPEFPELINKRKTSKVSMQTSKGGSISIRHGVLELIIKDQAIDGQN